MDGDYRVRSIEGNGKLLESKLTELICETNLGSMEQTVKIHNHVSLNLDFCLQLLHDSEKAEARGSQLGLRLV